MNQILFVEKSKKGNSLDINTVVKIFVIAIILLGIIFIGKGIFSLVSSNSNKTVVEPSIVFEENNGNVKLNITYEKAIDKIIYSWNSTDEITLQGRGRTTITEEIEIPVGTNILNIKIIDVDKKEYNYEKEFSRTDEDLINPEIEFVVEGSKVKIVAKDETALNYIMYRWDDEDNTILEAREDSNTQIEEKISILKGEHTLTVVAVDVAGNEQTKTQVFKGAKKPTIDVSQDNDELIISIKDEENVKKIELTVNGELFSTDPDNTGTSLDMKEVELRQKLQSGENTITITAYNVSGLSEQVTANVTV